MALLNIIIVLVARRDLVLSGTGMHLIFLVFWILLGHELHRNGVADLHTFQSAHFGMILQNAVFDFFTQ